MSFTQPRATTSIDSEREADNTPRTVQLLVADRGNRTVIREMLSEYFDVDTSQTVQDADLYLIEDHLFSEYHETLREQVERSHPVFCPVVLIRRNTTELAHPASDAASHEEPILIDDIVDAPVDRSLLIRRLHSLFVRRRHSQELSSHVSTLEKREQELRRFERGVESTGNGIVMTDRLGEIEYVNPAVEEITGYTESEILGETPRILQPAGAADVFTEEFWRTMIDRNEWEGEVVTEHSDETRSVVDTSITAIHDDSGDVEGFVIVLNDITERIRQEQELQRREQELDLLRQILTRYLRHNLRNDLNVILVYGEMLASDETLSDSLVQMAEKIVEMAQRLQEKSDTARQFSTLLQQDTELSPHDLSEIVEGCVTTISEQYPDVAFDIDVPETCTIRARAGIRDVVEELIDNAAEHNDVESPHVHIQLQNSNGTRLVIEDSGPGISELELKTLEEGKETPLSHSQGIGLWMSKWVIESVDGQLSFDRLDSGTRVTVEFPSPERVGSRGLDTPALKERDKRLQTVIDRMTDAIVEVNAAWEITFVDARAEEILDVSATEIEGKEFWDVFSDIRDTRFEAKYREAMNSRTSQHLEAYYSGIDGWLSVYMYPEFDGGLSFYLRETTERNEQRRRYDAIFNQTYQFTGLMEPDGTIIEANETALEFGGLSREDVIGRKVWNAHWFEISEETQSQTKADVKRAADGEFVRREIEVQGVDDTAIIDFSIRPILDENGTVVLLVPEGRDITDLIERERELRQEQQFVKSIFDALPDLLYAFDNEGTLLRWNDQLEAVTGYSADEITDRSVTEFVPDDEVERIVTQFQTALEHRRSVTVESAIETKDGKRIPYEFTGAVLEGSDGTVRGATGVGRDITARKQRERELRELEQFNRELVENAPVGLFRINEQMRIIYENKRAEEMMGVPADEGESAAIGKDPRDLPSVGEDLGHDVFDRLEAGETVSFELPFESLYGKKRYVTGQGVPLFDDGDFNGAILMIQDVTGQRTREQLFEAVFNNTYTLTGVMDPDGTLREANETALSFAGIDRDHVVGKPIWDSYWFQENQNARQTAKKAVTHSQKGELFRDEIRVQGEDDVMVIDFTVRPVFDESGSVTFLIPEGRDITDLKERERQLKAERRRFQSLVDVLPHGVYRADPATLETTYANDAFEQIHGFAAREWRDSPDLWEQALHPDDAPTVKEAFQSHRQSREPGQLRYRIQTHDGDVRWIEDTFRWEYDDAGNVTALVGVYTDVTKRKERECALEERGKELTALQKTAHTFLESDRALDESFEEFIERLPQSFQYPENAAAKIAYDGYEASTADFEPRERCLTAQRETETNGTVRIDVVYRDLEARSRGDDSPFLAEEQELLDTLVALVSSHVERWECIQQLQSKAE